MSEAHDRPAPPALLIDVMDTLVRDPFYEDAPRALGMSFDEMMAAKDPTAWQEYERGEIDEEAFLARYFADGRAYDQEGLVAAMRAGYRWIDGMEELLAELRERGVALHALSNYSDWYLAIDAKLGLGRYLSWDFVSCNTGVRKPDAEAYLGAARALALPPSECLFVDDRERNVAAAREVGMPAVRFEGAEALRAELAERGVLRS